MLIQVSMCQSCSHGSEYKKKETVSSGDVNDDDNARDPINNHDHMSLTILCQIVTR